jgi:hypothetical protein
MLTFFRKIRRSLSESGSARKFIFYAVGEIALVVIGILIALQINNWNESQKDLNQYKKYINGLIQDISGDIVALNQNERGNQRYAMAVQNLIHIYQSDANFTDLEIETINGPKKGDVLTLLLSIQYASFMVAPAVNKFTIEDIQSSGQTSIFKNEILKREVFNYYSRLERYDEWWQGKLRTKYAMDDVKFKLLDPNLLNLSNLDSLKRLEVISTYKINPDDIIKKIRSYDDLLSPLNTMAYTMDRISYENSSRTELAHEVLAKLNEERDRLK